MHPPTAPYGWGDINIVCPQELPQSLTSPLMFYSVLSHDVASVSDITPCWVFCPFWQPVLGHVPNGKSMFFPNFNPSSGFLTKRDSNQSPQLQRLASKLKICLYLVIQVLSNKRLTKALVRLRMCTGWPVPLYCLQVLDRFLALMPK